MYKLRVAGVLYHGSDLCELTYLKYCLRRQEVK